MPLINLQPAQLLRNHIKSFWYAEREFTPPEHFTILPDSYIELVFCFSDGPMFISNGDNRLTLPPAFIVGLLEKPLYLSATGVLKTFGIRFFPWAFYHLIQKSPEAEIAPTPPQFLPVHLQLSKFISLEDPRRGLTFLQDHCKTLFEAHPQPGSIVNRASKFIYQKKGLPKIGEVAKTVFTSPRNLSRLFKQQLGQAPKSYAQKVRFETVRDKLFEEPESDLTQLAYEFGYSDQAHFIADFRSFAGKSPSRFAKEMSQLRSLIQKYNVRFSQF